MAEGRASAGLPTELRDLPTARVCPACARGTTRERIAAEVSRLLSDQCVQHAANALGESIRQQDGATVAADLIEGWVTATSPVTLNRGPVDRLP